MTSSLLLEVWYTLEYKSLPQILCGEKIQLEKESSKRNQRIFAFFQSLIQLKKINRKKLRIIHLLMRKMGIIIKI